MIATAPELLDEVARVFEDEAHWCKGVFEENDAYCLVGAMLHVLPKRTDWGKAEIDAYTSAMYALCNALTYESNSLNSSPLSFNDAPATTIEDVRRVITKARQSFEPAT